MKMFLSCIMYDNISILFFIYLFQYISTIYECNNVILSFHSPNSIRRNTGAVMPCSGTGTGTGTGIGIQVQVYRYRYRYRYRYTGTGTGRPIQEC